MYLTILNTAAEISKKDFSEALRLTKVLKC